MYIRSAFWMGRPKAGMEAQFRQLMDGTLIPAMQRFPGVRNARALWPATREDHPPDICCQVLVEFDSLAERDRMLASAERVALRPKVMEAIGLFEGGMSHIEYEVGSA
jgi:hypothetical protein